MAKLNRKYSILMFGALGLAMTSLVMALYVAQPILIKQVEFKIYDYFLLSIADGKPDSRVVILDIDEKSIETYGQWPWSRYRLALLVEKLLKMGASSIGFDIVLAEPDRTSPHVMQKNFKEDLGLNMDFSGLPPSLLDNDILLGSMLKGLPVVLGTYLRFEDAMKFDAEFIQRLDSLAPRVVEFAQPGAIAAEQNLMEAKGITLPLKKLTENSNIGFFNIATDQDGLVRSVPLVVKLNGKIYASMALQSLRLALGVKNVRLNSGTNGLESINVGKFRINVSPQAILNIPFRGKAHTFPYISIVDLMQDKVSESDIKGKIVFIGTSSPGLLDIRSIPFDSHYPGVEVHANVVDAILNGRSVTTPAWTPGLQIGLMLLTCFMCTIIFARVRSAFAIMVMIGLGMLYFFGAKYMFSLSYFVSPLWGIMQVLVLGVSITSLRFWREEKDKKMIRQVFSRYVSPEVVSRIVDRGEAILKGEERELTIMFTDLRGFTAISEKLSPEQVVSLLNKYFTPMTALVRNSGGTLDKFIGDAIMAFWNAPLDVPRHSQQAVTTALTMLDTLNNLNKELHEEFGLTLNMGAGIHTGQAYVGNMGSLDLTSYTAIGDSVNLASRLEGLCSRYGFRIILSGETAEKCDLPLQRLARLRVKGRTEPVDIYTALSAQEVEERKEELALYENAMKYYDQGLEEKDEFILNKARELFKVLAKQYPARLLYMEYVEYCTELEQNPKDTWSGIWTLTSK